MSSDFEDRLEEMRGKVARLLLNHICLLGRYFSVADVSIAMLANGVQHRNDVYVPKCVARASSVAG